MSSKHLSEDKIQYVVSADASEAQQELHKLGKEISSLRKEEKARRTAMIELESTGKKNTEQYRRLQEECRRYTGEIKKNEQQMTKLRSSLDYNAMTMNQLKKMSKDLQRQLDDTSKSANPEEYKSLAKQLVAVNDRMSSLKNSTRSFKESFSSKNTKDILVGAGAITLMEKFGNVIWNVKNQMQELVTAGVNMAISADGVAHAFQKIDNNTALLENLRKSTKGTINDFELMKAAVKAKDFRIPLEDLGNLLSFAQLKAQQTGQSVEYMTESIVTGLGRQSKMILDNLGISAAEIDEKMAETGDFSKAVSAIVKKQMTDAGESYVSAADRAMQKTTDLQNAQLRLGQALLPWKEASQEVFTDFKISIMEGIAWMIEHKSAAAAMTVAVTGFTLAMTALNAQFRIWFASLKIVKGLKLGWTAAMTTARGVTLLLSAAIASVRGNTLKAAAAMKLFNASCRTNVIVAFATAVIAAGVALYTWLNRNKQVRNSVVDFMALHKKMAEEIKEQNASLKKSASDMVADEIAKVKMLRKTINDNNESYSKRKAAIRDLQKLVPGYHATLNGEGNLFAKNTKIIDGYIKKLNQAALAEAAYERLKENHRKILAAEDRIRDSNEKIRNVKSNSKKKYGVDLDRMNIQDDGYVRYSDVHRDDGSGLIDDVKANYKWDAGPNAQRLKNNQNFIYARTELIRRDEAVVSAYSKQNDRLISIIQKNGGRGQAVLNDIFLNKDEVKKGSSSKIREAEKEQKDAFGNQRKEDIAHQEKIYNASQEALKRSLAEKKITQEEYNAQMTAIEMAHTARRLDIERKYTAEAEKLVLKDANEKQRIVLSQQENEEKARKDFEQKHLDAMKQYYEAREYLEKSGMTENEQLEAELELQLRSLKAYYDTALEYAKANGEDTLSVQIAYWSAVSRLRAENEKQKEERKVQARKQAGVVTFEEEFSAEKKRRKEDYEKGLLSKEEYEKSITNLERDAEAQRFSLRQQYGLASQQEIYDMELLQLKQHLENKEITEEEYAEAVKNMKLEKWKEEFDYYSGLFGSAIQALQDAEIANMDAKYDAEIEAARNAGKDTTELEKKKANDKLRIQKKYADINFAVKASQIIADTSVAIMKALADLGPIAGPVAAAMMGVTGAAQLAAANAEREKVKKMTLNGTGGSSAASGMRVATGRESGGYLDVEREQDGKKFHALYDPDRRGYVSRPTVIVGEGAYGRSREWVASNAAVENPTVAPFIDIIDRAQRAGNIRTLDMNKILLQKAQGKASGGYVAPPSSPPSPSVGSPAGYDQLLGKVYHLLDHLSTNGIPASVALTEIDRQQKLRDQARNIGGK